MKFSASAIEFIFPTSISWRLAEIWT